MSSPANLPLTYLFVPGNRADRFDKALATGADAIIVDVEDAVAPEHKAAARVSFAKWYRESAPAERVLLRINDESTPWFEQDMALIAETGIRGVVLPKAESTAQIDRARSALPTNGFIVPLVETAKGIVEIDALACAPRVQRIAFGTLDYALDLDQTGDDRGLLYPSSRIALASRVARIGSPVAGVTPEIDDEAKLLADFAFARACGFGAKLCIHPKQVDVIRATMRPTESEIAWAKRVVTAAESATGAVQVDGKMVDRPVIARAMRMLDRA